MDENYTHLSSDSVDEILRNMGVTVSTPSPQPENIVRDGGPLPWDEMSRAADNAISSDSNSAPVMQVSDVVWTVASPTQTSVGTTDISYSSSSTYFNDDEDEDIIPNNSTTSNPEEASRTLLRSRSYYDNEYMGSFYGAPWVRSATNKKVFIAGAGGISSWAALLIARLGVDKITIIDDDLIEARNLSGQFFKLSQVSLRKSVAVGANIAEYSDNVGVETLVGRITNTFTFPDEMPDIVVGGFDNMIARKILYAKWYDAVMKKPASERQKYLFIDGRLALDYLQVFSFTGDQDFYQSRYEQEFLFDDREAESTQCSAKQTSYMANMIGGFISSVIVAFCAQNFFILPFVLEFDSKLFNFKVQR